MLTALSVTLALCGPPEASPEQPRAAPGVDVERSASVAQPEPEDESPKDGPKQRTGPPLEIGVAAKVVVRPEFRSNTAFNQVTDDNLWRVRQGARLAVSAKYGPVRTVVMLQDVRNWGDETTTLSSEPFTGIHQGFLEIGGEDEASDVSGFVRIGRQEVTFWNLRFIGNAPWQPAMRAFDAIRGRADLGIFSVDVGASLIDTPRLFTVEDELGGTETVRGSGEQMYWADIGVAFHEAFNLNLAALVLQQGRTVADPDRSRSVTMPAFWLHGTPLEGLSYQLEGNVQLGADGTRPRRSWSGFAAVGYEVPIAIKPSFRVSYELATGSRCVNEAGLGECGEATVREVEQFYGNRHRYRGFMDLAGMSNIRDLQFRFGMKPHRIVSFQVDYHYFQLHEPKGAWRDVGYNLVGTGWDIDNEQHSLGHEIDLFADIRPFRSREGFGNYGPLSIRPGYGLFVPVGAGARIGGAEPQHFVYLWLIAELGHRFVVPTRRRSP